MPVGCKVCEAENQKEIEGYGREAVAGSISWSEVARRIGWTHAKGVQNHMQRHYVAPASPAEESDEDFDALIEQTMAELREEVRFVSSAVKPFYLIAIQNLKGLRGTNSSQQHLTNALKAIHEVTGMKMEQQLMLDFAKHHFKQVGPGPKAALEEHNVIDLEPVDD